MIAAQNAVHEAKNGHFTWFPYCLSSNGSEWVQQTCLQTYLKNELFCSFLSCSFDSEMFLESKLLLLVKYAKLHRAMHLKNDETGSLCWAESGKQSTAFNSISFQLRLTFEFFDEIIGRQNLIIQPNMRHDHHGFGEYSSLVGANDRCLPQCFQYFNVLNVTILVGQVLG